MISNSARKCANCGTENPAEARFCFSCGAALETVAGPVAESRKTVTVLFCDLVGSTAMGEQIDPETLRGLLTRSFDRVSAIVERHGGVVEKFIGDAAMAVFGIPRVHEDDALRAVRAAAEIREALADAASPAGSATVAWRTGIATGEVVAGDATGGQRLVTGDAVNVAARLQQTAQPGEILITGETHRLVRDAVEVVPLGEVTVKGRQAPIETLRLLSVDRSAAGHERRLDSPMVGRERPRRQLDEAFAEARDDRICHLFTVLGAAGVGKSRLVNEFIASVGDQARVVRGRCLSYGEGITYWPIAEIVRQAAGVGPGQGNQAADVARVSALLPETDDRHRVAKLVSQTIGLTRGEPAPDETPWAIRSFFEALATDRPLVVVLDDLQWAQPPLLDLVEHIADWTRDASILLIVLARQELLEVRPAWGGGKRSSTSISLEPLDAEETAQLIDNLLGRADVPPTVFERIRTGAEGNPLFVEELLEMLIDEGALARTNGNWTARRDLASLAVPPTIQALLAARLDGLGGGERAVLERGAVEGTVFHRDAVAALAPDNLRDAVGSTLQTLTRREFVIPDRAELGGREAFRFRHQLIRDAAYQAIAKQSRADLHERFADWMEVSLADRLDEYRAILAYHLEQAARYRRELDANDPSLARLAARAGAQLALAGEEALDRGDFVGSANLLQRALSLQDPNDSRTIAPRLTLGEALSWTAETPTQDAFLRETVAIAEQVGDARSVARAEVLRLHPRVSMSEEPMSFLVEEAKRLHNDMRALGDEDGAARAGLEVAKLLFWNGHVQSALDMAQDLLATGASGRVADNIRGWVMTFAYWGPTPAPDGIDLAKRMAAEMSDPRLYINRPSRQIAGFLAMQGRFDEARATFEVERAVVDQLGSVNLLGSLLGHHQGPAELLAGNAARSAELSREGYDLLTSRGDRGFASTAAANVARALLVLGRDDEAEEWARTAQGLATEDDFGTQGPAAGVLAIVMSRRGDHESADELGREAVAFVDVTDQLVSIADAHADLATVLLAADRAEEAQAESQHALAVYQRKGHLVGAAAMRDRLADFK